MVAVALGSGAVPVAVGLLVRLIVDDLVGKSATTLSLIGLGVGITVATLVGAWCQPVVVYGISTLRRTTTLSMQGRLFAAVAQNPGIRSFEDPAAMDRLRLAQVAGESAPSQALQSAVILIAAFVTLAGFLLSLAFIAPTLAAIVGVAALPDMAIQLSLGRLRLRTQQKTASHLRRQVFYTMLQSDEPAARELRLFGSWRYIHHRMQGELRTINSLELAVDRRQLVLELMSGSAGVVVAGGGLVLSILWVVRGSLSVGDIALYLSAVAGTQGSLAGIMQAIGQLTEAAGGFAQYESCVTARPDIAIASQPSALASLKLGLRLENVWFRYADHLPWILSGVTFEIPAKATVALVGRNGAGKSTIVKLLCRFYDPSQGRILWDGVDIREFDVIDLRSKISAVFQDFMCYDFTLSENIGIGDPSRMNQQSDIRSTAETVGLQEVAERLPDGYDTMLSRIFVTAEQERSGARLSGGEWQRVALARSFLRRDMELVVLDEPSAGLDAASEEALHARMVGLSHSHSTLLVTHKMGAARLADRIVVLRDGRVSDIGSHEELLGRSEIYSKLFRAQAAPFVHGATSGSAGLAS